MYVSGTMYSMIRTLNLAKRDLLPDEGSQEWHSEFSQLLLHHKS